jgi:hypothetical protein
MLCLLFFDSRVQYRNTKIQKKRVSTQRYNNFSLLKGLRRFFIGGLYELLLEAIYSDDL